MVKNITNMLPSMESGWNRSATTYSDRTAILLSGTTSNVEVTVTTTVSFPLDNTHVYYARVYWLRPTSTEGRVGIYWPIAEPYFVVGMRSGVAAEWNLYSARKTRPSFSNGSYSLRLDFDNAYTAGEIYYADAMLIDLTECFGAGNEPTQEFCDENIPYFTGTKAVFYNGEYSYVISLPVVTSAAFSVNPVAVKASTVVSVTVEEVTKTVYPEDRCAGEFNCGE